jgi:hypothetical protein
MCSQLVCQIIFEASESFEADKTAEMHNHNDVHLVG